MGTEAAWVPYVLAAVAAGGEAYNQHNVARQQANVEEQRGRAAQRGQNQIDAALNERMAKLKQSTGEAERKQSLQGFLDELRANRGAQTGGETPFSGSSRFASENEASKAAIQNYGTNRADMLSRIVGPLQQRTNETVDTARTLGDTATTAQIAAMQDAMYRARAARIRANPWVSAGSQFAGALAGGMAGAGGPSGDEVFGSLDAAHGAAGGAAQLTPIKVSATRMTYPFG